MAWRKRAVAIGLVAVAGLWAAIKARPAWTQAAAPGERAERPTVTRDELYQRARQLDIPGRSRMRKAELEAAIAQRTGSAT